MPSNYRKTDWAPLKKKQHFEVYVPLSFEPNYFKRIPTEESIQDSEVLTTYVNTSEIIGDIEKSSESVSVFKIQEIPLINRLHRVIYDINALV